MKKRVSESIELQSARVDRDKGIIHDVLLLGPKSLNGREYPFDTRAKAVPLFEGAKVNLSHQKQLNPATGKQEPVLSVDHHRRFGKVINIRNTDSGLRGDLKALKSHAEFNTVFEAAEDMPDLYSFSPVFDVVGSDSNANYITAIERVYSTDLVTFGGTTRTIFEEAEAVEDETLHEEELEEAEEIESELEHLIHAITTELVDFHHDHKNPEHAHKRIGHHLRHHHKMHLAKEEPKEEEHEEEELHSLRAEKGSRRICEEFGVAATEELVEILAALPDEASRKKHVLFLKRQTLLKPATSQVADIETSNNWATTLRSK